MIMEIFNYCAVGAAAGILSTVLLRTVFYLGNAVVDFPPKSNANFDIIMIVYLEVAHRCGS